MSTKTDESDASTPFRVHLLDVGLEKYGDSVLIEFGKTTVLIDGAHTGDHDGSEGHPSIPEQLEDLLGHPPPFRVDLLIVSHAHEDHIGCLPRLVSDGTLEAKWTLAVDPDLAWPSEGGDALGSADSRVRQVVAGLREELRLDELDGRSIDSFLADAVSLEKSYRDMLDRLESKGFQVVRYTGGAADENLPELLAAFQPISLKILGPSEEQMLVCAHRLAGALGDAVQEAASEFQGVDAATDATEVYRRLARGDVDSLDASRLGNLVNLQSLVTVFSFRNRTLLFAGDMQFAKPGTKDTTIQAEVDKLRAAVSGTYDFAKVSHHGSPNAFDEVFLRALGDTRRFGICAGEKSTAHPHREVLRLLEEQQPQVSWARTDRNLRTTITFLSDRVRMTPTQGTLRDARPNSADEAMPVAVVPVVASPALVTPAIPASSPVEEIPLEVTAGGFVEVSAKIPHERTSVTIAVDVAPGPRRPGPVSGGDRKRASLGFLEVGGGRPLPNLLVVTNRQALSENIGAEETSAILAAIRAKGLTLIEDLPRTRSATEAARIVREQLNRQPEPEGVLILGGYDVVPAHRLDALPTSIRKAVDEDDDPDDFIVWSDEVYGSLDGDTVADIPVSRIPDGKSSKLVFAALRASGRPRGVGRAGIRNVERPFADAIFRILPGKNNLLKSKPTAHDQAPPLVLDGDFIYLMLHGDSRDGTRFWGEGIQGDREAVNLDNLPAVSGPVVFTGCCWGALIVDQLAARASDDRPLASKTPESSIALAFLARGANAFIGCTGAHYSPEPPFGYYGGPMHEAFWRAHLGGMAPAAALHEAKRRYAADLPHGQKATTSQAIESKILRQYTCLGLGF